MAPEPRQAVEFVLQCRRVFVRMAALLGLLVMAGGAMAQSRGELLYTTHCIACHNTQVHWRDQRLASDWNSLKAQVQRWQGMALLDWPEDDIVEVTRHLNERIYRFAPPAGPPLSLQRPDPRLFAGTVRRATD